MYHGILNVYKEAGYTSHDVVARLRGICKQKRIGHTGTLDPDAVGVLPVCLGNGTRLCDMLTDRQKEYVADFRLGITTDTQDSSGRVLCERQVLASPQEVREAILSFEGDSLQVPPMYSALKVGGKKLCDLARAGKEVERRPRPITVYSIEILKEEHPDYQIRVACSKGTYIRTLCHDVGELLGCGAVMTGLKRTRAGEFRIEEARSLEELQKLSEAGRLGEALIPVADMFRELPALKVGREDYRWLENGNQLKPQAAEFFTEEKETWGSGKGEEGAEPFFQEGQEFRMYSHENIFYGIYRYDEGRGHLVPVKMFLPDAVLPERDRP